MPPIRFTGPHPARRRCIDRRFSFESLEQRQLLAIDLTFSNAIGYATGQEPSGLAVADIDGDGRLDLIVANAGSDSLSLLRGTADGSFDRTWPDVRISSRPVAVAAGDLDHDGFVDLVTANEGSNRVSILRGTGDGQFRTRNIRLSGLHESISLADLNDDDRLDIVVTTSGFVTPSGATNLKPGVHTILSTTDPRDTDGFERPDHIYESTTPVKVIASRFDEDDHTDLVIAHEAKVFSFGDNDVTLLLGSGGGSFDRPATLKMEGDPQDVASGDFDGDGLQDLAVVNEDDNSVGILFNRGGGVFASEVTYHVVNQPSSITVADFDADGDPDLAVTNQRSESISTLVNQGDGSFLAQGRFMSGERAQSIVSADFNADGLPDLAMAIPSAGEVIVLLNRSMELPRFETLSGQGSTYRQGFDASLAASDGPGARLPVGWTATLGDSELSFLNQPFPGASIGGLMSGGLPGAEDRALAIGVANSSDKNELAWTAKVEDANAESIRVSFDIEAWLTDRMGDTTPGEASFHVLLEADSGEGLKTIHDFGNITTGRVLDRPAAPTGVELWKTDGTNVSLVADIVPGAESSNPGGVAVFNNDLYFVAGDRSIGDRGIYKTDGSEVSKVVDIPCSELDLQPRNNCSNLLDHWVLSDALYYDLLPGNLRDEEVRADMFTRIDPSGTTTNIPNNFHNFFYDSFIFNDEIYLVPEHDWFFSDLGRELWKFDGKSTVLVEDINPRRDNPRNTPDISSQPGDFVEYQGYLYFTAGPADENEREIWRTDGTRVERLTDIIPGDHRDIRSIAGASDLTVIDGQLYFVGESEVKLGSRDGRELWSMVDDEAVRLAEIFPGPIGGFGQWGNEDFPMRSAQFTGLNGEVFFIANDGVSGRELWKWDGQSASRVTDINEGSGDSFSHRRGQLIVFKDEIYFPAQIQGGDFGLWKTDGDSVSLVGNLNPNGSFFPASGSDQLFVNPHFFASDDALYFLADDGATGLELWRTDGTSPHRVTDINTGPEESFTFVPSFTELGGEIYFTATSGEGQASIINGNLPANRLEFDSGPLAVQIPEGATIRIRFSAQNAGQNAGFVYGLDNFGFEILREIPGDANRDGIFNSSDLVQVFRAGEYGDTISGNSTWEEGDWDGDGDFTSSDLVTAFQTGMYVAATTPVLESMLSRLLFDLDDIDDRRAAQLDPSLVDSALDLDLLYRPNGPAEIKARGKA